MYLGDLILRALIWGVILLLLFRGQLKLARLFCIFAFHMALFGVIHAPELKIEMTPAALSYLISWGLLVILGLFQQTPPPKPLD